MSYADKKIELLVATIEEWFPNHEPEPLRDWTLDQIFYDAVYLGRLTLDRPADPEFRERAGKMLRVLPPLRLLLPKWGRMSLAHQTALFELEAQLLDAAEAYDRKP